MTELYGLTTTSQSMLTVRIMTFVKGLSFSNRLFLDCSILRLIRFENLSEYNQIFVGNRPYKGILIHFLYILIYNLWAVILYVYCFV